MLVFVRPSAAFFVPKSSYQFTNKAKNEITPLRPLGYEGQANNPLKYKYQRDPETSSG
jgi:hypothetical protein